MTSQNTIEISTRGHGTMEDMTARLGAIVAASEINVGIVNVAVVGSTAAIAGLEFEPGLERDLPELLDRLIPPSRQYGHEQAWHDGNGHSHLQSSWLGQSLTLRGGRAVCTVGKAGAKRPRKSEGRSAPGG